MPRRNVIAFHLLELPMLITDGADALLALIGLAFLIRGEGTDV
jgi:hypothetical protein